MILMMSLRWCVSWCYCGGAIDASCPATGASKQCECKTYDPVKGIVAVVDVVVLLGWVWWFELV